MWIHFLSFSFSYRFCSSAPGWLGVQSDRAEEAAGGREEAEAERRPCRHRPGGHGNHIRILLGDWSLCVCSLRCRLLMMLHHHFQPTTWNLAHLKKLARKSTLPLKSEFYRLSVAGTANYLQVYPSLALLEWQPPNKRGHDLFSQQQHFTTIPTLQTSDFMSEAKDWAGELISGQTGTGRILVSFIASIDHYLVDFNLYAAQIFLWFILQKWVLRPTWQHVLLSKNHVSIDNLTFNGAWQHNASIKIGHIFSTLFERG